MDDWQADPRLERLWDAIQRREARRYQQDGITGHKAALWATWAADEAVWRIGRELEAVGWPASRIAELVAEAEAAAA